MKNRSELSFLLIYVPADRLDAEVQGVSTWEQSFTFGGKTSTSSKLGVTLIPVEELLDSANNWKRTPPVQHRGDGRFWPPGFSLTKLILEMLLCHRGEWLPPEQFHQDGTGPIPLNFDGYPVHYMPYREISVSFNNLLPDEWNDYLEQLGIGFENINLT